MAKHKKEAFRKKMKIGGHKTVVKKMRFEKKYSMESLQIALHSFNLKESLFTIVSKDNKVIAECKKNDSINIADKKMNAKLLDVFENHLISPAVLKSFKRAELEGKWNGDLTYEKLFEAWYKLRKRCSGVQKEMCDVSSTKSSTIDGSSLPNKQSPIDRKYEVADKAMLDPFAGLNSQTQLPVIDGVDENSFESSCQFQKLKKVFQQNCQ